VVVADLGQQSVSSWRALMGLLATAVLIIASEHRSRNDHGHGVDLQICS
jgi:hypothetical protein